MSERITAQLRKTTARRFTSVQSELLQRTCACGQHTIGGGECTACRQKREGSLQRRAINQNEPTSVPPIVHEVLRSPGQPLDPATRAFMEPRFGHDFSRVRVHTDARAAESARAVNALAYTIGGDVVFGAGKHALRTSEGARLLAHELAHVVQQRQALGASARKKPVVSHPCDSAEREADRVAGHVTAGELVHVRERPSAVVQGTIAGTAIGVGAGVLVGAGAGALLGGLVGGPIGALVGAGIGAVAGGIAGGFLGSYLTTPLTDTSTFQSPGASGWWGAIFGCYRNGCTTRHKGWDIHAPVGTEVRAMTWGVMTQHENPGGWGHYVRLKSKFDKTRTYLYAHLAKRELPGEYLPGQKIGETGTSGNASADRPHLHFEVQSGGKAQDPSDFFAEPTKVIETLGSPKNDINKAAKPLCNPCAM